MFKYVQSIVAYHVLLNSINYAYMDVEQNKKAINSKSKPVKEAYEAVMKIQKEISLLSNIIEKNFSDDDYQITDSLEQEIYTLTKNLIFFPNEHKNEFFLKINYYINKIHRKVK